MEAVDGLMGVELGTLFTGLKGAVSGTLFTGLKGQNNLAQGNALSGFPKNIHKAESLGQSLPTCSTHRRSSQCPSHRKNKEIQCRSETFQEEYRRIL